MSLEDVQKPVAVIVTDGHAHPRLRLAVFVVSRSGFDRNVGECAVAVIAVEDARSRITGDVEVRPAVVVEVGDDRGHCIVLAYLAYTRSIRDVSERSVPVVVIKEIGFGR